MGRRWITVLFTAFAVSASVTCGGGSGDDDATAPSSTLAGNLLVNSGFEQGSEGWVSLSPNSSFEIANDRALTGSYSAALRMDDGPASTGDKVYYLVQEITPGDMPEMIRGAYRVENWQKGTPKQYLQFVVIAFGPDNFPTTVDNWQLRYLLAGIDEAPFVINNAKFLAYSTGEPAEDVWVTFEAPLREDFMEQWGLIPEGFEKLRLLFEVRYDDKVETDGLAHADVYYDDLYIGDGR